MSHPTKALRTAKFLALAAFFALAACGGGADQDSGTGQDPPPPPPPPATGSLTGSVVTLDADAVVSGAVIHASAKTASADAAGRFELSALAPANRVLVRVSAPDYLDAFVRADIEANVTTRIRPRLAPASAPQTIDAGRDNIGALPNSSAEVRLPANSLAGANGAPIVGPVRVALTPIDPASEPDSMPGGYVARVNGTERQLESFGAVKVDLRDADGNRLNLAQGRTATLRIPLATRSSDPPATVPLFYFDESAGVWIEDGAATLSGEGTERFYEGAVTHFTYWNADKTFETIMIRGCLGDANGVAVRGLVTSSGVDYSGQAQAATDAFGNFAVAARANSRVVIYAESSNGLTKMPRVLQTGSEDIQLERCMEVIPAAQAPGSAAPLMPPVIVGEPVDQSVTSGELVAFFVAAVGSPVLEYQWRRNGVDIPGAKYRSLVVFPAAPVDNGAQFSVVVTNKAGSATSRNAMLQVSETPQAPAFVSAPQPAQVFESETATFSAQVEGSAPLSYRWRRDGVDIGGATGSSYTTPPTTLADDGAMFSLVVSNAAGEITSPGARLTVSPDSAPRIETQPRSINVPEGTPAAFVVQASGGAALTYQWQRDGVVVPGGNQPALLVATTSGADNGATFRVVVSNENGTVTSAPAVLYVARGAAADQLRILRLSYLWTDVLNATAAPVELVDEDLRAIAAPCSVGAVTATVDGAPLAAGTQLPIGTHTLAATFNTCELTRSLSTYLGESRVSYTLQSAQKRNGAFTGNATDFRIYREAGVDGELDVRVTASGRLDSVTTPRDALVDERATFTPDAGSTVFSIPTGRTATVIGGTVVLDSTYPEQDPNAVQRVRTTYQGFSFRIDGVTYALQGFHELEYAGNFITNGSGEVTIRADGEPIGRVFATPGGLAADAFTELESF